MKYNSVSIGLDISTPESLLDSLRLEIDEMKASGGVDGRIDCLGSFGDYSYIWIYYRVPQEKVEE